MIQTGEGLKRPDGCATRDLLMVSRRVFPTGGSNAECPPPLLKGNSRWCVCDSLVGMVGS